MHFSNHTGYKLVKGQILSNKELSKFDRVQIQKDEFRSIAHVLFLLEIGDVFSGLQENGLLDSYSHLLTGYIGKESFLREVGAIVKAIREINPHIVYGTSLFQRL